MKTAKGLLALAALGGVGWALLTGAITLVLYAVEVAGRLVELLP